MYSLQLSDYGQPVVLISTPFASWRSANWTPELLADQVSTVVSKKSKKRVFKYFAVDQPLSSVEAFKEKKTYKEGVFSGKHFFQLLSNSSRKRYYYASGGIELLKLEDVFTEESLQKVTFGDYEPGQVNFWFGGENVTAYTHYDTSHNLHAIMYGRKRFLLFPPAAYKELELYPSLHEFYRQVQTDIFNLTQPEFKTLWSATGAMEVVLRPGEVLYIPPYWFHCVVTMETTISLNVWSHSDIFLSMEDIYASPIPFEEVWGTIKLLRVVQHFITLIIQDALPHYASPSVFIRVAVLSRYKPIFAKIGEKNQQNLLSTAKTFCIQSVVEELLDTPSLRHVTIGARNISALFQGMHPIATREINVANYFEHVVWRILGTDNIGLVPFYFWRCF